MQDYLDFFHFMRCDKAAQKLIKDSGMVSSEIFFN